MSWTKEARELERRWCEEFGESDFWLRMPDYGSFEVMVHGKWLPAQFTLEDLADTELLIAKVKSILQEAA